MEQEMVTKEELENLMREVEGIKSTIEILRDRETMDMIRESENLKEQGVKPFKIDY